MTDETTPETASEVTEKPNETSDLALEPIVEPQNQVPKKPRETKVYNHGTGYVTFVQALKLISASKTTLSRYTKEGRISYETDDKGTKWYQVVELERVFGKLNSPGTDEQVPDEDAGNHEEPSEPNNETALELALLKQENQFLRERAERAETAAQDWKQHAERITLMLPQPKTVPETGEEPTPEPQPEPKKSFLQRLLGGK